MYLLIAVHSGKSKYAALLHSLEVCSEIAWWVSHFMASSRLQPAAIYLHLPVG